MQPDVTPPSHAEADRPRRVLIVSERPLFPMDQGYRVHGCQIARALTERGHAVTLASVEPTGHADTPPPSAPPAWLSAMLTPWPAAAPADVDMFRQGWGEGSLGNFRGPFRGNFRGGFRGNFRGRGRLAEHQGVDPAVFAGILPLVRQVQPEAVVALGQHGPMLLRGLSDALPGIQKIWYAADEPVSFELSCLRREPITRWRPRLRSIALHGALQVAFARGALDGIVGVSPVDTRRLARINRPRQAVCIPNGVDLDAYPPARVPPTPRSLVFWGRMDFEPNVDAVCWLARRVWPTLRQRYPDARWHIVGKHPSPAVRALGELPGPGAGITVTGAVDDIRDYAHAAAVTVLPMRCGHGIKNKLLEAAAMARPIVASPRACAGLAWDDPEAGPALHQASSAGQWVRAIAELWDAPDAASRLGARACRWVQQHHTWAAAADRLVDLIPPGTQDAATAEPVARLRAA